MRGKPINVSAVNGKRRITPAGAGKTVILMVYYELYKDHPRRCGENIFDSAFVFRLVGSPPQVRGKLAQEFTKGYNAGITPAGAGKTELPALLQFPPQDHPRRCGENPHERLQEAVDYGSPPQVRGKPSCCVIFLISLRITPAGAGKTLKRSFRNQPFCS